MDLTNDILIELIELEQDVKQKQLRIDEIKASCRERGSFSTKDCICVVYEQTRESILSLAEMSKIMSRQVLDQMGLIKSTTYKVVKVAAKEKPEWLGF